jgi:hypothetical protein
MTLTTQAVSILARATHTNPRRVRSLVELLSTHYPSERQHMTKEAILEFLQDLGYDEQLLATFVHKILVTLFRIGKRIGPEALAARLRCDPARVKETERVLAYEGLLEWDHTGRRLTAEGERRARALACGEENGDAPASHSPVHIDSTERGAGGNWRWLRASPPISSSTSSASRTWPACRSFSSGSGA